MSLNLNRVELAGTVSRTPEVKPVGQRGTLLADLSVSVTRTVPGREGAESQEETDVIDVQLWSKNAQAAQGLRKGDPVFIEARLKLETWQDKQSGQTRSKLKVIGEKLQALGAPEHTAAAAPADSGERRVVQTSNYRPPRRPQPQPTDDALF
jgi:single-strand DNA-binding protein